MTRKVASIPETQALPHPVRRVVEPMRDQLNYLTGVGNEIQTLSTSATLADCIAKINEIINRIQLTQ